MKNYLPRISKLTFSTFLILTLSFFNSAFACDFPAFDENADRTYAVGDIISRNGKDYEVKIAGWANAKGSDYHYAPGTGVNWTMAWDLKNDPCTNTGTGGGATCSDGIKNQDETGVDCGGSKCSPCNSSGATCSDGIMNQDETGIDCEGSKCSPCNNNNNGTGTTCTGAVNDHGHGTWYNNLDVQPNGVVKCSFERADILGTKYGALDKGLLIQNGSTPYCGMCVEAKGDQGTAIIQIVDECPDCWDRAGDGSIIVGTNTKFGDIDLSIAAFQAVVDINHVQAGIGDFDWKEVTCPWQNNLHLIIQGSHAWYAKVIIGNHTNRVASVEISNDGGTSYQAMTLGVDNGWVKGSFGGDDKTFKITDIYGNEVVLTVNDMDSNGNTKIDGGANFPACNVSSSNESINSLDFVTTYPNPANTNITFSGLEDVNTIQIVNVNGKVVGNRNLSGNSAQITFDVSNLAAGIYVAKLTNATATGAVTFVKK